MFLKLRQIENQILKCFWSSGIFLQLTDKQGNVFVNVSYLKWIKTLIKNPPNYSYLSFKFSEFDSKTFPCVCFPKWNVCLSRGAARFIFPQTDFMFHGCRRRFGVKAPRVINEARVGGGSGLSSPCSWASQFIIVSSFSRRLCFCIRMMEKTTKFIQDDPQKSSHSEKIKLMIKNRTKRIKFIWTSAGNSFK